MKTGVIFDLDGTLLDTLEDLHRCTNYVLRQYGCPPRSLTEIRRFVGNGARRQIQLALPGEEDDPPLDEVLAAYQTYYHAHCRTATCPYPGTLQALDAIREKYPVAVVSNKPHEAVAELCREFAPRVEEVTGLPVNLWDERRTTVEAHNILSEHNYHGKKRKNTVDAVAASLILEGYLAFRKR